MFFGFGDVDDIVDLIGTIGDGVERLGAFGWDAHLTKGEGDGCSDVDIRSFQELLAEPDRIGIDGDHHEAVVSCFLTEHFKIAFLGVCFQLRVVKEFAEPLFVQFIDIDHGFT